MPIFTSATSGRRSNLEIASLLSVARNDNFMILNLKNWNLFEIYDFGFVIYISILMNLFHLLKNSVNSLLAHKMRSFLTMLGMIIGIAAVLIIMSIGASAQDLILGQIRSVGSNLIGVLPGASDENGPPATALGITVTTFKF